MANPPEINPYAPPAAALDAGAVGSAAAAEGRLDRPLFSARQIGAATFFGSLFAGVLLLQANFRVMRRSGDANKALLLGLLALGALIAVVSNLPRGVGTPINIALTFAMSSIARSTQGEAFFKHTTAGGERRSNWLVFAIIIGTVVGILAVVMAGVLVVKGTD
jgi:hypothetical protein